jgi:protein-tyrosine kinase
MSRVYRALEKAEKEKSRKALEDPFSGIFEEESTTRQEEEPFRKPKMDLKRLEVPIKEEASVAIAPRHSFAEEQFGKIKTCIFRRSPQPPRSILITSSAPGEGKTTVSVNLGIAISHEINTQVILIDADLRKPSIYRDRYLNSKGLSDYLADQSSITEIMTNFEVENFMIIPAGTPAAKPAELIGSKKMKELLRNLRDNSDDTFILIDSPPVLSTSEPLLLSELVDGVILVVMAGHVPKAAVRRVVDSIGREKIIGVVFNQKDLKPMKHHYDHYYRYYKK